MKLMIAIMLLAITAKAGVPVKWDVRYGDSTSSQITPAFTIVTRNGDTTFLQPRFLSDGRPIALTEGSLVRAYFRQYGSTNAYVASSATGTVYTTAANKGRVTITVLDSDYAATTNEFYVGVENDGMMFSPWGKLTVADGPGVNPTTNANGRTTIDWSTVDQVSISDSGFATDGELTTVQNQVQTLDIAVTNNTADIAINAASILSRVQTNASITATLISNKTYSIIFTNP